MSAKSRRPDQSQPSSSRTRTQSLSIARSPSILSGMPPSPLVQNIEDYTSYIPYPALERTLSHPPSHRSARKLGTLSGIPSDDDLLSPEEGGQKSTFLPMNGDEHGEEEDEEEEVEDQAYTGAFQPPDSKEMLGILLSVGGVAILAIAAGLTTIFDWVL